VILEVARMWSRPEMSADLPAAVQGVRHLVESTPGCLSFEFRRCVEEPATFLLLVGWATLADHTEGFRASERFPEWRAALEPLWERLPEVHHYEEV